MSQLFIQKSFVYILFPSVFSSSKNIIINFSCKKRLEKFIKFVLKKSKYIKLFSVNLEFKENIEKLIVTLLYPSRSSHEVFVTLNLKTMIFKEQTCSQQISY
jgi:hypothetical protein